MSMSGWINAKCKVCGKVETWYIRDIPFPDSEVVGTCCKCSKMKGGEK